jgi:hypothetical protein
LKSATVTSDIGAGATRFVPWQGWHFVTAKRSMSHGSAPASGCDASGPSSLLPLEVEPTSPDPPLGKPNPVLCPNGNPVLVPEAPPDPNGLPDDPDDAPLLSALVLPESAVPGTAGALLTTHPTIPAPAAHIAAHTANVQPQRIVVGVPTFISTTARTETT